MINQKTDSHLTASFPGQPGKLAPERIIMKQEMWQWHQLEHVQIICISLQTDNHASTSSLSFFTGRMLFLMPNQHCQSTKGISQNWFKNPPVLLLAYSCQHYVVKQEFLMWFWTIYPLAQYRYGIICLTCLQNGLNKVNMWVRDRELHGDGDNEKTAVNPR